MIKSIGYDQHEIIGNILDLHCNGADIELDPTYGNGCFYRNSQIKKPKYCYDVDPTRCGPGIELGDCRYLHLHDNSIGVAILDGPYGIGSGPSLNQNKKGQNITPKRFGCFPTGKVLFDFYTDALIEMYRVLKPKGVLILKIQPVVGCGKQHGTHFHCANVATKLGFYFKDEFILVAKHRVISGKIKKQQHARKYHCYFYVFIK